MLQTQCDTLQRGMCCIIVQRRTPNATKKRAATQILQRACHDTAMYPMAKEYTLMQPFENVMRRCNQLQYGI
jgi:hypothetical protein